MKGSLKLATQTTKTSKPAKATSLSNLFLNEIKIQADVSQLALARDFVGRAAKACGFSHQEVFDITLATNEAVANAIEHGSPKQDSYVKVSCGCAKGNFIVKVKDTGKFCKVVNMKEGNYRGRGILLMLALMDTVAFDESPEGTTVCLMKKCS